MNRMRIVEVFLILLPGLVLALPPTFFLPFQVSCTHVVAVREWFGKCLGTIRVSIFPEINFQPGTWNNPEKHLGTRVLGSNPELENIRNPEKFPSSNPEHRKISKFHPETRKFFRVETRKHFRVPKGVIIISSVKWISELPSPPL